MTSVRHPAAPRPTQLTLSLPPSLPPSTPDPSQSPFCFVVEALQGHRELMAFKAPRVEDAEEWVSVLQALRGTSFFEAKDRQRTGVPHPPPRLTYDQPHSQPTRPTRLEGTVGPEAARGSTRAADAAFAAEAATAANVPPSAHPHVQAPTDAVPVAEHGCRVGMLVVSPSRTVLSVPAELASVDAVAVAEVAAKVEADQLGEDRFRGAYRYRGADIEGWGLDDDASLGIDGRTPSDSVHSVESIDDSDIPKCSFMMDPEHDTMDDPKHDDHATEELGQEPGMGEGPGQRPGPIKEQSNEEEEDKEEWEEVRGLGDVHHSRGGAVVIREEWFEAAPNQCFPEAWGQLPPGLGPAPRGWKSSWRTLFML